jgi:hypothetical protein
MLSLKEILNINFPENFGTYEDDDRVCNISTPKGLQNTDIDYGVSKYVIFFDDDTVIKIPFNGQWYYNCDYEDENDEEYCFSEFRCKDYCAVEEEIYNRAYDEGLEMFFAATEFIGNGKCGKPFYKSERVLCLQSREGYDFANSHNPSQKSKDKANERADYTPLPFGWLARAYEYYGEALVERFIKFIDENNITDLHDGNLGFRKDGAPVLLDYSGF